MEKPDRISISAAEGVGISFNDAKLRGLMANRANHQVITFGLAFAIVAHGQL